MPPSMWCSIHEDVKVFSGVLVSNSFSLGRLVVSIGSLPLIYLACQWSGYDSITW